MLLNSNSLTCRLAGSAREARSAAMAAQQPPNFAALIQALRATRDAETVLRGTTRMYM